MRVTRRGRDVGVAYVAALMILTVVLILGLSLATLTSGEARIGANDRVYQRVLRAAESGIHLAVAKELLLDDGRAMSIPLPTPGARPPFELFIRAETSPVVATASQRCHLCQSDAAATFWTLLSTVTSTGMLRSDVGPGDRHRAAMTISATVAFSPCLHPADCFGRTAEAPEGRSLPDRGSGSPRWGQIALLHDDVLVSRTVAIVGTSPDPPQPGIDHVFRMIEVESGRTLFERTVAGLPGEIAMLDGDDDGHLDALFFGTSAGLVYKVDLQVPQPLVADSGGERVVSPDWDPYPLFADPSHSFQTAPIVIFDAVTDQHAIAFGTAPGAAGEDGMFFLLADWRRDHPSASYRALSQEDATQGLLPLTPSDLAEIGRDDLAAPGTDPLHTPAAGHHGGWVLLLDRGEHLTSNSLAVAGVVVFSTAGHPSAGGEPAPARVYVLDLQGADPILDRDRARSVGTLRPDFLAVAQAAGTDDPPSPTEGAALRRHHAPTCRFGRFGLDLTASGPTASVRVATLPLCVELTSWREF